MKKKIFDDMLKKSLEYHSMKQQFDEAVIEEYGTHYGEHDKDEIIDTLDYGQGKLTYERFSDIMNKLKKEIKNDKTST